MLIKLQGKTRVFFKQSRPVPIIRVLQWSPADVLPTAHCSSLGCSRTNTKTSFDTYAYYHLILKHNKHIDLFSLQVVQRFSLVWGVRNSYGNSSPSPEPQFVMWTYCRPWEIISLFRRSRYQRIWNWSSKLIHFSIIFLLFFSYLSGIAFYLSELHGHGKADGYRSWPVL